MKRRCVSVLTVLISLFMLMIPVYGLTPVETDRICTITVEGYPGEGAHFYFYKVANCNEQMEFTLTDAFKPYADTVIVNDIHEQDTWAELANTLSSYVYGDQIPYTYDGIYQNGTCQFQVETGLYLMLSDPVQVGDWIHKTVPMLISVPTSDKYIADTDEWLYDYTVVPKQLKEPITHTEKEYKVIKQWQDGRGVKRPTSITVNILKNGKVAETVVLNKENDWCYTWKAEDDGSVWQVQEVSVPSGYKVSVQPSKTTYFIRNYQRVPDTSDTPVNKTPMAALCISGTLALLSGYLLLINRKNEESE